MAFAPVPKVNVRGGKAESSSRLVVDSFMQLCPKWLSNHVGPLPTSALNLAFAAMARVTDVNAEVGRRKTDDPVSTIVLEYLADATGTVVPSTPMVSRRTA